MQHTTAGRAVSPTNTSHTSNYRTASRTHFEEFSRYLASYLASEPPDARSIARQKLMRLTRQQFQELSTDVYDELIRRKDNADCNEVPFLPVRDDMHYKRNQARQKLATLLTSRFKDLSFDVYYELTRLYPEFEQKASVEDVGCTTWLFGLLSSPTVASYARASLSKSRDVGEATAVIVIFHNLVVYRHSSYGDSLNFCGKARERTSWLTLWLNRESQ